MKGKFIFKDNRNVYSEMSVNSKVVATYNKGETVNYHSIHIGNGHAWIEYKRGTGGKGFVPIGLAPDLSMTIK